MSGTGFDYQGFEEARARLRRRRRRILLPIGVVAIMLLALVGTAVLDYRMMREDALALSQGVIINLQSRIETEVEAYLLPISGIIRLTRDLLGDQPAGEDRQARGVAIGVGALRNARQLSALFAGDRQGAFLMVRRLDNGQAATFETKLIPAAETGTERKIEYVTLDAAGKALARRLAPWDNYDPRERPWYSGAQATGDLFWTDVYPFFSSHAAGITASLPVTAADGGVKSVIGADVTLQSLSLFLQSLTIGKTGIALIADDQGTVIAHPRAELIREGADGGLRLTRIDDLRNPVVTRAFDHFRVEGHGRREFDLDGRRYISSTWSLEPLLHRAWTILIVVPEDDFVGFVVDNVRQTLLLGLSVITLAALLAGLLIRQGLRADRDALHVLEQQALLDARASAIDTLAGPPGSAHRPFSEAICRAADVHRVSIWHWSAKTEALECVDCYDRDAEGHTRGTRLLRRDHPALFEALQARTEVVAPDVGDDARLASLDVPYLSPLGCRALLGLPIAHGSRVRGALWLEDQAPRETWPEQTVRFARAAASLLALRVASATTPAAGADDRAVSPTSQPVGVQQAPRTPIPFPLQDIDTSLGQRRAAAFAARLSDHAGDVGARLIDALPVMTLRLTDATVLAAPAEAQAEEPIVSVVVRGLQEAAAQHRVAYLKFFSDQVVASVDPNEDSAVGLDHVVAFALDAKTLCENAFAGHRVPLAFRIGIDIGPAIGSVISQSPATFAFWGEAVQTAGHLADSGLPGAIHVSETVYQALRDHYLFQLRGHHYLEGLGEFTTYLLGGRL